jgi:hypothetical protein
MNFGTKGCMYNCGDSCTGKCMKPMDGETDKKEKFVDWIESLVGQEIVDYNIKPKFDADGNVLSYDIMVQPKTSLQYLDIPITISSTDKTIESYE